MELEVNRYTAKILMIKILKLLIQSQGYYQWRTVEGILIVANFLFYLFHDLI